MPKNTYWIVELHAGLGWVPSDPEPVPGMPEEPAETAPPRMAAPTTAAGGTDKE
jgi:hypothetical protein